ncbi:InlB B-repeat-containing protein [Lysinibacillus sp. G4S2]|uniref:InlB B-repeat-containing protein n=1 Tax=Lysinibacillus sp. G4S2 TaxID=3055859 RepID=UPI0025A0CE03|nr:InlB B-repeat-containing protein [Lysinibacillus sp. G4S2]MDM5246638.1 InlB B-repeat-containing protein [Lysinibacillus sp. G4S2]
MKKAFLLLAAILLLFSQLSLGNLPAYANGDREGDYITESVNGGVAIVGYKGESKDIDIPNEIEGQPVVEIGYRAFRSALLTSVKIPSSVTKIGISAFEYNRLISVEIPPSVTTIGSRAFYSNYLTSIELPSSIKTIGHSAFHVNRLDSVTFQGESYDYQFFGTPFDQQGQPDKIFIGWFEDADHTIKWTKKISQPMTIYGKWSHYIITFDSNGGNKVSRQIVGYKERAKAPSNPEKEDHIFAGWYKDKELTEPWDFDQDVETKDITLYAKWNKSNYLVTFDTNGGSEVPAQTVGYNELVQIPIVPKKEGYTFAGWHKDKELTEPWGFEQDVVTEDITLYAKWTKVSYIVTFDSNGGSKVSSQSVGSGELVKAPSTPVKEGYTFAGWYKDKGLTEAWNFDQDVVEKDITLYAKWSKASYIVTFDANGGSEVSSQTVGYNELVKAPSNPTKAGYTFNGWHKDKELTVLWDFAKDVVTKNVTLYAKWTKESTSGGGSGWAHLNTVTFDSNGGSKVPSQTVGFNDLVKAPSTPVKADYQFVGWYKDAALNNAWDFAKDKVTADITLYAKWTKDNYIVTFDSNGGSKIPSQTVAYKALVKAPSNPKKEGYLFIGWYKNKEFTKAWDFAKDVVAEDLTLYARWMKESNGCDITFKDIDHNWAQDMIKEVAKRCIIIGYPDGTFRPNDMTQRQHVVLMIDRALQPIPIRESVSFSDVPKSHPYYEQITRLQRAGIVDGSNETFRPNAYITRAQMAKMMVLAFGLTPTGNSTFKDVDPSHWASGYIAALADHNIALGDEDGNFRPNENLTRAQFTAFMYRALNL